MREGRQRGRIFEAFTSAHARRDSLGLGLYIAERIAHAHDGRVEVESSLAEGTTFRVSSPRYADADR